ncbi:universal stress protein [Streptosporangium lutulentum]|uniref:Nucleotide-binding universal stress UspA family protein n=1 Tax=Streptosporangium lutulentum TaxID=1461250 RepID=A0ABT9QA68_9ACTN|nr:universal stress protein [Streptosporangium lutulentum]MDP9843656.1 nucleotide-binding universal stress UspA family protein [Streptosporangium lutulentum]
MTAQVVVGADGSSPADDAVEWAADDAVRRGCALKIVHVCEPWTGDIPLQTPPGFRDSITEYGQSVLESAAELARGRAPHLEVDTVLEAGRVAEVLRGEAEDAEQVVVGSRGLGGFTGLLLGSVSLALAGQVATPVVVVRGASEQTRGQIVVGFDGSAHSEAALAYAFEEASRRQSKLHAIHTWQMPVVGPGAFVYTSLIEDIRAAERRVSTDTLTAWWEKYPKVEVEQTVVCGHPVDVICKASAAADLVVVGSRGLGRFGSAMLGSVSHGILHHARCSVAVVPPWGRCDGST